jgi:hypothetical protein
MESGPLSAESRRALGRLSPIEVVNRGEPTVSVNLVVRSLVGVRARTVLGRLESIGAGDLTFVVVVMGAAGRQQENEESDRQRFQTTRGVPLCGAHAPVISRRVSPSRHRRHRDSARMNAVSRPTFHTSGVVHSPKSARHGLGTDAPGGVGVVKRTE